MSGLRSLESSCCGNSFLTWASWTGQGRKAGCKCTPRWEALADSDEGPGCGRHMALLMVECGSKGSCTLSSTEEKKDPQLLVSVQPTKTVNAHTSDQNHPISGHLSHRHTSVCKDARERTVVVTLCKAV